MKKKSVFSVIHCIFSVVLMVFMAMISGYAMAEGVDGTAAADLEGAGKTIEGPASKTGQEENKYDNDWFLKQVNQKIVEMKFCGTPIDQILRQASANASKSIVVKYYSVGQRPLRVGIARATEASGSNGGAVKVVVEKQAIIGVMDTLLVMDEDGNFIMTESQDEKYAGRPLQLRVSAIDDDGNPKVYATNGVADTSNRPFKLPALPAGAQLLRMGRAAAEIDVNTGSFYQIPEPSEQYCQRFIMMVEETTYSRLSEKEVDWTFTRLEKMSMEDMRIGMEATGLFGNKGVHKLSDGKGLVYLSDGIYWHAGKDATLGHWEIKKDSNGDPVTYESGGVTYYVQEYVITEDELIDLVSNITDSAGNTSRKKMVFVDRDIYSALCKIRTNNRIRLLEQKDNYMKLGLDFESYTCMGTTLLFYRHDLFNEWGFVGKGFALDPEYLDKWVFKSWERNEYDLKKLFVRNSNAVVMEEFSCWTLAYPDAHCRISMPTKTEKPVPAENATVQEGSGLNEDPGTQA